MIWIVVALALALAVLTVLYIREKLSYERLEDFANAQRLDLIEYGDNYRALEIGRDEETEAYEQMMLAATDAIKTMRARIAFLEEDKAQLLEVIEHKKNRIAGLSKIVHTHTMICLPDLVEQSKDPDNQDLEPFRAVTDMDEEPIYTQTVIDLHPDL